MLTVGSLLDELELESAAGSKSLSNPVRWVHISELEDPTPWLSGGELMLTTGISLKGAAKQRALVRRLANHNLAGLGFGTGTTNASRQGAIDEAGSTTSSSRCPTRCRSSLSPRRRRGWSTSSMRCCSAGSCSGASNAWCSRSGPGPADGDDAAAVGGTVLVLDGHGELLARAPSAAIS